VEGATDHGVEDGPVGIHPHPAVDEDREVRPQPPERHCGRIRQGAHALEEHQHPGRHARDETEVLVARSPRGGGQALLPAGDRRDLGARGVASPDPGGQASRRQAGQVADLGVPAEGLGPGGAAEEEQGPVERLRPPDSMEREEKRVEPALAVHPERLARDGMYLSPAVVPDVLQYWAGRPGHRMSRPPWIPRSTRGLKSR
jgi:hypothetical protein